MNRDVVLNKCSVIERCIERVIAEYGHDPSSLKDITRQDSIVLNLMRACEAAIDLSMHLVAEMSLGIPQSSRDSLEMLGRTGIVSACTVQAMKNMVGFRNIAVQDYQSLNLAIVQAIVERHLNDFHQYTREILFATIAKDRLPR